MFWVYDRLVGWSVDRLVDWLGFRSKWRFHRPAVGRSMAKTRRVEEGRSHSFHARVGPRPARLDAARSVFSCHPVRFFEGFATLANSFFFLFFFVKYTRRRGGLLGGRAVSARSLLPPKHPRRRTYGSKGRRKTNCKLFFFLVFL